MPVTPVGNGEHAADVAEKDAAKAAAAAEKAAKDEAEKVLGPLTDDALAACNDYLEANEARNVAHLALGFAILKVEESGTLEVLGSTIAEYCESHLSEVSQPSFGTSAAYRALQAARVASSVSGGIGGTSTDALRPMHRVVSVPGATTKVYKAAKAAAGRGKVVRKAHIDKALEDLFPKDEAKSPGPAKGTAKPKATQRNTPVADDKSPVEVPDQVISATRLKSAATRVGTLLEAGEEANPLFVAAGIVKCCEDYGIAATREAVKAITDEALALAKAAKPKATPKAKATPKPKATK